MHEIHVRFTGRSGNHFLILLNVVRQVHRCSCVLRFKREELFRVCELRFDGNEPIPDRIYNFPWEGSSGGIHAGRQSSWKMQRLGPDQECRDLAQRYLLPIICFPISPPVSEQICVIHLRTIPDYIHGEGSSHGLGPHYYRQPEPSYYDRCIDQFSLLQMKVLLVVSPPCGDSRKSNPAVKHLVDKYGFASQTSSMHADIEAVSRAHTIVWSVSSFIWMCSLLSTNVQHNIVPSDFGWRTALCSSPGVGESDVKTSIIDFAVNSSDRTPFNNQLTPGQRLVVGDYLVSTSGEYTALLQEDGNFCIRGRNGVRKFGTVQAAGYNAEHRSDWSAAMLADGNFCVYRGRTFCFGTIQDVWHTRMRYYPQKGKNWRLVLHDDGSLCVYDGPNVKFDTTILNELRPGRVLRVDEYFVCASGQYKATMQRDGNFVVKSNDGTFLSGTVQMVGYHSELHDDWCAQLERDGTLLIYRNNGVCFRVDPRCEKHQGDWTLLLQDNGCLCVNDGQSSQFFM